MGIQIAKNPLNRRKILVVSVVLNLSILFIFKYFNFFLENCVAMITSMGVAVSPPALELILPLGISFFTFQKMTYVIELSRGNLEPSRDFADFALFVCFFPLLQSGPIERATSLLPQINRSRAMSTDHVTEGVWLVTWGLFKKVFIADNLAPMVNTVFAPGWSGTGAEALMGIYAYTIQIYCDFSGYTDMARGIAKLLGFDIRLNFDLPYFATNPSDFWKRWHISLSTWIRDYLYIPLGGSREGEYRTYRNLLITMVLVGLWHGAAWTFVVWGAYQGCLLIIHRIISRSSFHVKLTHQLGHLGKPLAVLGMFHLTCFGWLIFRAQSLDQVMEFVSRITMQLSPNPIAFGMLGSVLGYAAILIIVQVIQKTRHTSLILQGVSLPVRGIVYGVLFYLSMLHGGISDSFIYAQF
ncbi:MAG: MBOAT family O-acyltransferase [Nitrospiraceae bacterium]